MSAFSGKALDGLSLMLRAFARANVPSKEEAYELVRRAQAGDTQARNEMIERNMRLVVMIAKRKQGQGAELEDLIQEGVFGLKRAIEKFDLDRGLEFATYASRWVAQVIGRYVSKHRLLIWVPSPYQYEYRRMPRESRAAYYLSKLLEGVKSLDMPQDHGRDRNPRYLKDEIPDRNQESMAVWLDGKAAQAELHNKLDRLDDRSRRILWARACGQSLQGVAAQEGLTRERIRQLQNAAMDKLAQEYGKMKPEKNLSKVLGSTRQPARRAGNQGQTKARPAGTGTY